MPADRSRIGAAKTFLHHVLVKNVYFTKIHGTQRKAANRFVTVCFRAAFVVHFFGARIGNNFHVVSVVVVLNLCIGK